MSAAPESSKHKRRWYQFSLQTLLIVMTLFTVVVALIGYRLNRARTNRDRAAAVKIAVAAIEELGGEVTSEYEKRRPRTWLEELFDDPGDADDPVGVLEVSEVFFYPPNARVTDVTQVTDVGLEPIKSLTSLKYLTLDGAQITDAGLEHLKGLTNLRILSLGGTSVSDTGLEHLTGLTQLEGLTLYDTQVTDAGLKHLKNLTRLKSLDLDGTHVTDVGLEYLKGLPKLSFLWLRDTSTKRNYARLVFSLKSNAIILPRLDSRHCSQGGITHDQGW